MIRQKVLAADFAGKLGQDLLRLLTGGNVRDLLGSLRCGERPELGNSVIMI